MSGFLRPRGARLSPAQSVGGDLWIPLCRTALADPMTKLRLCMGADVVLEALPIPGIRAYPFTVGTDRDTPAQHLHLSERVFECLCAQTQLLLSRLAHDPFCAYGERRGHAGHEFRGIHRFSNIVHRPGGKGGTKILLAGLHGRNQMKYENLLG